MYRHTGVLNLAAHHANVTQLPPPQNLAAVFLLLMPVGLETSAFYTNVSFDGTIRPSLHLSRYRTILILLGFKTWIFSLPYYRS